MLLCQPDDDTLVPLAPPHEVVSIIGDGEDVRWFFTDLLVAVLSNVLLVVDRQ